MIFLLPSCHGQDDEFVRFVVQPGAEVGKTIPFYVHFEQHPDSIMVTDNEIDGLKLNYNLNEISENISESHTRDGDGKIIKTYYSFEDVATPTKTGRIDFPVLTVLYKGKEYKGKPFHIDVSDSITIGENDVKVIWTSDKTIYRKRDTITVSLYEYSRFSETKRKHLPSEGRLSLEGEENGIKVGLEETIDHIVGIDDFEERIGKNFEIVGFDWNPFRTKKQRVEFVEDRIYIKTMIAELQLLAKSKGTFDIGASEFDFSVYKSTTDLFQSGMVSNDDGSHTMTDRGATKLKLKSNALKIEVK